jgi:hypothetical protein
MSKNINGDRGSFLRETDETDWNKFDRLPRAVKKIYWYSPIRLLPTNMKMKARSVASLLEKRRAHMAMATIKTYGPQHPDACGVVLR